MTDGDGGASNGLPNGWVLGHLPDLADVIMGQSPPGHTYNTNGEGLPFFQGKTEFTAVSPVARKWCSEPSRVAMPGDILMSIRAPVGPTNVADQECAIGRGLAIIRPHDGVSRDYLRAGIRLLEAEIASWGTGTTFNAVNKKHLASVAVPVPPSGEQHRIAARLGKLEQHCDSIDDSLRAARTGLDRLRGAVLAAACSGRLTEDWRAEHPRAVTDQFPVELGEAEETARARRVATPDDHGLTSEVQLESHPPSWNLVRLGDILDVATGATPLRKNRVFYEDGTIPWVTSGAVNAGTITSPTGFITLAALEETNVKLFPPGTLLIAMYGEGQTRGRVAELAIEAGTNQALAAVLFTEETAPIRPYVRLFFEDSYRQIRALSVGGVQPNLNLGMIKDTLLPLPSRKERAEIIRRVDAILVAADRLVAQIEQADDTLDRISRAVLVKAFRGELVPTEAELAVEEGRDYETAEELLARVADS